MTGTRYFPPIPPIPPTDMGEGIATHLALAELLDDLVVANRGPDDQDVAIVPSWDSRKGLQERRLVTSYIGGGLKGSMQHFTEKEK